jgi:ribosomal protein S12 methylthiotransferase
VVVNTCGFITDAKQESVEAILEVAEAKRQGSIKRLIVSGCMTQAYAEELREEIPEIDAFVGLDGLEDIVSVALGSKPQHVAIPNQVAALRLYGADHPRLVSTGPYAYLKVAEGCNNPCAFCHIPAMRGSFRSRSIADLVAEARKLEASGVHELVLIAQDTTRYGEDLQPATGLAALVKALLNETGIPWIRFLYAYPATLSNDVIELMATETRFVSYLDIPLQHCNRRVLKAMKRGGDSRTYSELVAGVRNRIPDIAVRSTFIVGFPGEDEEAFGELAGFVETVRFDHLGVFTYSWQEENPGAELGDPIPAEEKKRRMETLLELQQGISLEHNRQLVGRKEEAIVEGPLEEMPILTSARLRRHAPEIDGRVLINDGPVELGALVEVEISEAHPYDLVARSLGVTRPGPRLSSALPVII